MSNRLPPRWPGLLLLWGLPLAFVILSWWTAAGFPYYLDNNETFLSYVHARNLEIWDPFDYGWLTAEATDPSQPAVSDIYSHNPNGPRYLHYALLRAGLRELPVHVLAISVVSTLMCLWLLTRAFWRPGLSVVAFAVVLDYVGFLSWTVNTYRVWVFVLFFGLVLAVARKRHVWMALFTFLLFQLEYGTALFVGATMTMLVLLLRGWRDSSLIAASAVGALLSVGLFAAQVLAYYGPGGFMQELTATYVRRGTAGSEAAGARFIFQAWNGLYEMMTSIARDTYNRPVLLVTVAGIGFAFLMLRRPDATPAERFTASLTLSTVLGALVTSTLLYGYFLHGFVESLLPLTVFLIAPAFGVVALELGRLIEPRFTRPAVGPLVGLGVLLPLAWSSVAHFEPPVAVPLFELLQGDLRGRSTVSPSLGAAMMGPELAFALADGRAASTGDIEATPTDLSRLAGVRDEDGGLFYVCLDTLYLRQRHKDGAYSVCEIAASRLARRGHQPMASGLGWTVIPINPEDRVEDGPDVYAGPAGGRP
ncbi:MAG: hypothetical protein IT306_09260 [Chloroflexi bacterium]|nr:hypothetical protein [Chloroflexota bacterium]